MSERLEHQPKHNESLEHLKTVETAQNVEEVTPKPKEVLPPVESIRHEVEKAEQDNRPDEVLKHTIENTIEHSPSEPASRELKQLMFNRTINKVQHQLSVGQKLLSKVVHQPTIDRLSEVGGKTVARPYGILTGGVLAFLGSSFYLYIAKHNHYKYNYLLFVFFFIGGFIIGLLLELTVFLLKGHKAQRP